MARLAAEQAWVTGILADLDTGRLTWPAVIADISPLLED